MKLIEIFDHTEILDWQRNGKFELAKLILDNAAYLLQIESKLLFPKNQVLELVGKKTAEVSFNLLDIAGDNSFSTSNSSTKPIKVYGAVLNGLAEKFTDYDAFYFSAERRHSKTEEEFESKKEIYLLAANKAKKRTGALLYESEDGRGAYWLLSKIKLSAESLENIKMANPLKEALLAAGFSGKFVDSQ